MKRERKRNGWVAAAIFLAALLVVGGQLVGERPAGQGYVVAFYNVENLFDTIDQPEVQDEEFTPGSGKEWNSAKYALKLERIARALCGVGARAEAMPAVIGLAEVENRCVAEDLTATGLLAETDYRVVHYDSPDARGIDVALLYRPELFDCEGSRAVRVEVPGLPHFRTRDILTVWGTMGGERFLFLVAHLPSRRGGAEASEFKRCAAAAVMRRVADSVLRECPDTRIVMMGDMNDDPTDKSLSEVIGAADDPGSVQAGGWFNPFAALFAAGRGTLGYGGEWNLFDNIILSGNLLDGDGLRPVSDRSGRFGYIYDAGYLLQQEGRYAGFPERTFAGDRYLGGYSDHLPVYVVLSAEK